MLYLQSILFCFRWWYLNRMTRRSVQPRGLWHSTTATGGECLAEICMLASSETYSMIPDLFSLIKPYSLNQEVCLDVADIYRFGSLNFILRAWGYNLANFPMNVVLELESLWNDALGSWQRICSIFPIKYKSNLSFQPQQNLFYIDVMGNTCCANE